MAAEIDRHAWRDVRPVHERPNAIGRVAHRVAEPADRECLVEEPLDVDAPSELGIGQRDNVVACRDDDATRTVARERGGQQRACGGAIEPGHVHAGHVDAGVDPVRVPALVGEQRTGPHRRRQYEADDHREQESGDGQAAGWGRHIACSIADGSGANLYRLATKRSTNQVRAR